MGFLHPSSPFQPPTVFQLLLTTPLRFLISLLHHLLLSLLPSPRPHPTNPLKIICISDTHTHSPLPLIPPGDILIHAGDLTSLGTHAELSRAITLLKSIHAATARGGFAAIIVIGGNHDSYLDPRARSRHDRAQKTLTLDWGPIVYLEREAVEVTVRGRTLKVFGMPDIPKCGGKDFAWQYPRGQGSKVWEGEVPEDVDVLITHAPPKGYLDIPLGGETGNGMGCRGLREEWWRVKPALHVFGHVHSGHGRRDVGWDEGARRWERVVDSGQGFIGEWVDWRLWWNGGWLIWWGFKKVLWTRVWGGEIARRGILVNASLTYQTTNDLGNDPQVVYL